MDKGLFDQVGIAFLIANIIIIMLVTWCVTKYIGCYNKVCKLIQNMKFKIMKKVSEIKKFFGPVTTSCAQTETMRFTERLTNYGDKKVDLCDKFDKFCEICAANIGNEAVGFCKMCEKFMCLNCCKHHEKIPLSESHVLLGKDEFKGLRNEKKMFDKSYAAFDNYWFQEYISYGPYYQYRGMKYDSNNQLLCLAQHIDDVWNSIGCFVQKIIGGYELMLLWQDNKSREIKERSILSGSHKPGGICKLKNVSQKSFGWYITIPDQQKIYKYADKTCVEFMRTCGKCYGIAVFNECLAISLNLPTNYLLPEWQVQFISYEGTVRKQICFDNEGGPLFKEPKHLTSNDAEDILFVSDQGNHSVIALDIKGYTLFKYMHDTIKTPRGITCDDDGNIYVASENKIVQIDQHGSKSRVILNTKEKRSNLVIDVCYNKFTSELGVLSRSSEVTILKPLP
jgi:hypothetical protein